MSFERTSKRTPTSDIYQDNSNRADLLVYAAEARVRATVAAINELAERVDALANVLSQHQIVCEIEPGLGEVVVNGDGQLLQVEIDAKAARLSRPNLIGERIMAAIRSAEAEADRFRNTRRAEISRSVHLPG